MWEGSDDDGGAPRRRLPRGGMLPWGGVLREVGDLRESWELGVRRSMQAGLKSRGMAGIGFQKKQLRSRGGTAERGGRHPKAPQNTPVPGKVYTVLPQNRLPLTLHLTDTICTDLASSPAGSVSTPTHLHTPRPRVPRLHLRTEHLPAAKRPPPSLSTMGFGCQRGARDPFCKPGNSLPLRLGDAGTDLQRGESLMPTKGRGAGGSGGAGGGRLGSLRPHTVNCTPPIPPRSPRTAKRSQE